MRHWPLLLLLCASCAFVFDRTLALAPGEVRGRAHRVDVNTAAPYARVTLDGSNLIRRANADGSFVVGGLGAGPLALRIDDDADGDGWPDRGAFAAARLQHADGGGSTSVLLGSIDLVGTMRLRGTVTMQDGSTAASQGFVARVVVTRDLCFALNDVDTAALKLADCARTADRVVAGAEAITTADATGAFEFTAVVSGAVDVAVVLYQGVALQLGPVLEVTPTVRVVGDAATDPEPVAFVLPQPSAITLTQVQVSTLPLTTSGTATFTAPGHLPACPSVDAVDGVTVFALTNGEPNFEVPIGLWDVTVCGAGRIGRAFAQAAVPVAPGDGPVRVRVNTFPTDPCTRAQPSDVLDCDGDGQPQLPPLDVDTASLWTACAGACPALGEALGARSCTQQLNGSDRSYDCDDDADGQPDAAETPDCLGAGRGTDLDGDRQCSTTDPYPQCAQNIAAACPAGTNDVAPRAISDSVAAACGSVARLTSSYNGARDLAAVDGRLYALQARSLHYFTLRTDDGNSEGFDTVSELVGGAPAMGSLARLGTQLYAAGGAVQAGPPSPLWIVDVSGGPPANGRVVSLVDAAAQLQISADVISSRFVAATADTVYVVEHSSGGNVVALDRVALETVPTSTVVPTDSHPFDPPIDARGAVVVGTSLAILSASGGRSGGPSVIFIDTTTLDTVDFELSPGTVGGMLAFGTRLFVGSADGVRAFDTSVVARPVEVALPASFVGFHPGADVHGIAKLDDNTIVVGSSTPAGQTHLTLFNLARGRAVAFIDVVDDDGFGVSGTDAIATYNNQFVYALSAASAAPQHVIDVTGCPRE